MTTTLSPTAQTSPTSPTAPDHVRPRLDERRLAAIGAFTFATIVIAANVLQGATPAMDAEASEIITYLDEHRTQNILVTVGFAIGAPFLLLFASAFYGRLKAIGRAQDLVWARLGMIGALLILPMFASVVVQRIVLLVGTDEIIGSPELVTLMWRFEMASFLLNALPIGAAILGFGVAGARAGLLPSWFRRWTPVAATIAVVTAASAVAGLEGSVVAFGGFIPFATWMLLLYVAGFRQLRSA